MLQTDALSKHGIGLTSHNFKTF